MHLLATPRWIVFTVVAIAFSVLCIVLGWWQGSRTLTILEAERAAASAPVDVLVAADTGEVIPAGSIGRPVTATGEYRAEGQVLVANRELDGRAGLWVLTPLALDGSDTWVPVLRGWVADADDPATAVPDGEVDVSGVLQPYEDFYRDAPVRPDGLLIAISRTALTEAWQVPTLSGFVVLREQVPAGAPAPTPVTPTVQTADVPFPWQNAAYTVQWAVFAAVVWAVWARWLVLDLRRERDEHGEPSDADADTVTT